MSYQRGDWQNSWKRFLSGIRGTKISIHDIASRLKEGDAAACITVLKRLVFSCPPVLSNCITMGMERGSPNRVLVHIVIKVLREFGEYNSPISTDQFLKNKLFKEHKLHVMTRLADYVSVLVNLERNSNSNMSSKEEKSNIPILRNRSMSILANTGTSKMKMANASQKERVAKTRNKEYDTFLNKDKLALGSRNSSTSPTSPPRQLQSPKSILSENETRHMATPGTRSSMSGNVPPPPPPSSRRKSDTDIMALDKLDVKFEDTEESNTPPPPIGMSPRQRRDSATKYVAFDKEQSDASNLFDSVGVEEEKIDPVVVKPIQTISAEMPMAKLTISTESASVNSNMNIMENMNASTTTSPPTPSARATSMEIDNRSLMSLLMTLGRRVRQLEGLSVIANSEKQSGVYKDNITPRKRITRTFARNLNQLPITMDGSPRTPFREMNASMNLDVDINNKEILSMHDLNGALTPEYPSYANTSVQEEQILHNVSMHSLSDSNNIHLQNIPEKKMGSVYAANMTNNLNEVDDNGFNENNIGLVDANSSPFAASTASNAFTTGTSTGKTPSSSSNKYPGASAGPYTTSCSFTENSNGSGSEYIDALFLLLERRMFHKIQDELMKQMEQRIQQSEYKESIALQNTFSELDDVVADLSSRIETLEMLYKEAAADRKHEQQELESFMSQTKYASSSMRDIGNTFRS